MIAVTAAGRINSGNQPTNNGGTPSGIAAGFFGLGGVANQYVSGNVFINNAAVVTAAGHGIQGYNFGYGNVTVNDASGANITAGFNGIYAHANGGFTDPVTGSALARDIAVTVYANTTITAGSAAFNTAYGIFALSTNAGSISVVTSTGDTINSQLGGAGINAVNEATSIAPSFNSSVVVTNVAAIHSGDGHAGSAASRPVSSQVTSEEPQIRRPAISRTTASTAKSSSTTPAILLDSGDGIRAYNYGVGDVTVNTFGGSITALGGNGAGVGIMAQSFGPGSVRVTTSASTTISAGRYGIAAIGYNGGNVTMTNYATVNGGSAAIDATTTAGGIVTIDNFGILVGNDHLEQCDVPQRTRRALVCFRQQLVCGDRDTLINDGTINLQSGTFNVATSVTGAGTFTIASGSTLEFGSSVASRDDGFVPGRQRNAAA